MGFLQQRTKFAGICFDRGSAPFRLHTIINLTISWLLRFIHPGLISVRNTLVLLDLLIGNLVQFGFVHELSHYDSFVLVSGNLVVNHSPLVLRRQLVQQQCLRKHLGW